MESQGEGRGKGELDDAPPFNLLHGYTTEPEQKSEAWGGSMKQFTPLGYLELNTVMVSGLERGALCHAEPHHTITIPHHTKPYPYRTLKTPKIPTTPHHTNI